MWVENPDDPIGLTKLWVEDDPEILKLMEIADKPMSFQINQIFDVKEILLLGFLIRNPNSSSDQIKDYLGKYFHTFDPRLIYNLTYRLGYDLVHEDRFKPGYIVTDLILQYKDIILAQIDLWDAVNARNIYEEKYGRYENPKKD